MRAAAFADHAAETAEEGFAVAGAMVGVAVSLFGLGPMPIGAAAAGGEVIGRRDDGLEEELGHAAVAALTDAPEATRLAASVPVRTRR